MKKNVIAYLMLFIGFSFFINMHSVDKTCTIEKTKSIPNFLQDITTLITKGSKEIKSYEKEESFPSLINAYNNVHNCLVKAIPNNEDPYKNDLLNVTYQMGKKYKELYSYIIEDNHLEQATTDLNLTNEEVLLLLTILKIFDELNSYASLLIVVLDFEHRYFFPLSLEEEGFRIDLNSPEELYQQIVESENNNAPSISMLLIALKESISQFRYDKNDILCTEITKLFDAIFEVTKQFGDAHSKGIVHSFKAVLTQYCPPKTVADFFASIIGRTWQKLKFSVALSE